MPLPPFDRQMGAGKTWLQPISLNSCNWVRQLPHRGLQEAGFHTDNCFALIMDHPRRQDKTRWLDPGPLGQSCHR